MVVKCSLDNFGEEGEKIGVLLPVMEPSVHTSLSRVSPSIPHNAASEFQITVVKWEDFEHWKRISVVVFTQG